MYARIHYSNKNRIYCSYFNFRKCDFAKTNFNKSCDFNPKNLHTFLITNNYTKQISKNN